jgi:hypothetical protein
MVTGRTPRPSGGSTVAGAGAGVTLLGFANSAVMDSPTLKAVFTYSAPIVAVLLSIIWAYVALEAKAWLYRRRLRKSLDVVRDIRDAGASAATPEHKKKMQRQVERLELLFLELEAADSEALVEMLKGVPLALPPIGVSLAATPISTDGSALVTSTAGERDEQGV